MTVRHPDQEEPADPSVRPSHASKASRHEGRRVARNLLSVFRRGELERGTADPFRAPSPADPGAYDAAFANSALDLDRRAAALAGERGRAAETMRRLLALSPPERRRAVRTEPSFQSWPLCERLIEECHQSVYAEAANAEELANLAVAVAEELDPDQVGCELVSDMRARAWAAVGEVLRVTSDLRSADEAFTLAEAFLERGTGDPLEQAWLQELKSCLRRDQWRIAEADRLLEETIAIYRRFRDLHLVGRAYIHRGRLYGQAHDAESALLWLQKGLALIEPHREPGLELAARHGALLLLHESGRHQEAWFMLRASKGEFLRYGGELLILRLLWLEGKLRWALGDTRESEAALAAARAGFIRQGVGFDAALVSLDLAQLYAETRRPAEMRALAEEMLVIFQSRDLHREAIAALILFQRSLQMDTLSSQLVDELGAYLRRARNDHRLHFEYPA